MERKVLSLFCVLMFISLNSFAQRMIYNINSAWQFSEDMKGSLGENPVVVDLPHTWNIDAQAANESYNRTSAGYVKFCDIPKNFDGKTIYARFYGVSQRSEFFVNSKFIGSHNSGYTASAYDISNSLTYGSSNTLWVRVSNVLDLGQMPISGDYNIYGGMYRDAELVVVPGTHICIDKYATDGIYITPDVQPGGEADVNVKVSLCLASGDKTMAVISLQDEQGITIDSLSFDYRTGRTEEKSEECNFHIVEPHRWNGTLDPYMYKIKVRLDSKTADGKSTYDEVTKDFGIRVIEVDENNKFLLNGEPYEIHGVTRFEDWPIAGNALTPRQQEKDFALMKEMGVNAVRLVHYPQNDYFLSLCDKAGIIVWSEIPFTGPNGKSVKGFIDSEKFRENGKLQLTEMIYQQYNHPSVCFWGLYSEVTLRGDDPSGYVYELNGVAKRLDHQRLTVASSTQDGNINEMTDIIGFNQSFGWTDGDVEDLGEWAAEVRKQFSQLKIGLSSYGAGGSTYQQMSGDLVRPDSKGSFHPEQWQTYLHESYWKTIKEGGYFWGTFIGSMFDHSVSYRKDGYRKGMNDNGLISFDRTDKKDAFYYYKANWNPEDKFVHLVNCHNPYKSEGTFIVKAFSNENTIALYLNGELLGDAQNNGYGVFEWPKINLKEGSNTIKIVSDSGVEEQKIIYYVKNSSKL